MEPIEKISQYLHNYDGPELRFMEVCGTHTAAIAKNGIPSILSPKIHLISGPGCPVCVTVTDYIDKLVALSRDEKNVICSFGDLLRVPGSGPSLSDAKAEGAHVTFLYAPMQMLELAGKDPDHNYIFAAVGFETTAPVYALMLEEAASMGLKNVQILTSLKTMPEVIRFVVNAGDENSKIDGFIAPGHVAAVTGSDEYAELAKSTGLPFVISGFTGPHLMATIYELVRLSLSGKAECLNLYTEVVNKEGNRAAKDLCNKYYEPCDASLRGMGIIKGSGLRLRQEYACFDAGSTGLDGDHAGRGCQCARVLTGKIRPNECPLFGKTCTPQQPNGACMVSQEGSCYSWYVSGRTM